MQECCLRTTVCGYVFVGEECFQRSPLSGNHAESGELGLFSSEERDNATDEDLHGLSTTHDGKVEMPCVTQRYVAANTSTSPSTCLPLDVGTHEVGHLPSGRLKDPSSNQHEKADNVLSSVLSSTKKVLWYQDMPQEPDLSRATTLDLCREACQDWSRQAGFKLISLAGDLKVGKWTFVCNCKGRIAQRNNAPAIDPKDQRSTSTKYARPGDEKCNFRYVPLAM
jgi:hypothetical protein